MTSNESNCLWHVRPGTALLCAVGLVAVAMSPWPGPPWDWGQTRPRAHRADANQSVRMCCKGWIVWFLFPLCCCTQALCKGTLRNGGLKCDGMCWEIQSWETHGACGVCVVWSNGWGSFCESSESSLGAVVKIFIILFSYFSLLRSRTKKIIIAWGGMGKL